MYTKILIPLIAVLLSFGCSAPGSGPGSSGGAARMHDGKAQKGPFSTGSQVLIQELDSGLNPTGVVYSVEVFDDLGSFAVPPTKAPFVDIVVSGFYYDEIADALSAAPISLRTVSSTGVPSVRANMLTSMVSGRVRNLVLAGADYGTALTQAELELLTVFHLQALVAGPFDQVDLTSSGLLLAVGSVMLRIAHDQAPASVDAQLSLLIAQFRDDLADDGLIETTALTDAIWPASNAVDVAAINARLDTYYGNKAVAVATPDFTAYLDRDGDQIPEMFDNNMPDAPRCFVHVFDAVPSATIQSEPITISGITPDSTVVFTVNNSFLVQDAPCLTCYTDWPTDIYVNTILIGQALGTVSPVVKLVNGDQLVLLTTAPTQLLDSPPNVLGEPQRVEVDFRLGDANAVTVVGPVPSFDFTVSYQGERWWIVAQPQPGIVLDGSLPDQPAAVPPTCQ